MIICKAKRGVTCDHKRNLDAEAVFCNISATKQQCIFAVPAEEVLSSLRVKMNVAKGDIL